MSRVPLQIGRQSARAPSPAVSVERLVNGYLEQAQQGREVAPVYGIPGMVRFSTLAGEERGSVVMAEALYTLAGKAFGRVGADGAFTSLGEVASPSGLAFLATDGFNIVVVTPDDGAIYVYNGSLFGPVTDTDAPLASSVDWVDGYFIFSERNTDRWFLSELADPEAYDALDFASAEWVPDFLVRVLVHKRNLLLFGKESVEGFRNVGEPTFPFTRLEDVFVNAGLIGPHAACISNDAVFFLAHDKTVRRLDGVTATRISTYAMEAIIGKWSDPGLTKATAHVWRGHLFVVFHNPGGCLVFDQATQLWHERASYGSPTWRGRTYVEAYGRQLFGSQAGALLALDGEALAEDGELIRLEMVFPFVVSGGKPFTTDEVEVLFETGSAPDYENPPKAVLEVSDDGLTFRSGRERVIAPRGRHHAQVRWHNLGQSRQRTYRMTVSDPCRRVVLGAYAEINGDD